jgi:hypothetical protein
MTHNALTIPANACSPDASRAGPAMPEHIARILCVVRILLEYGRYIAATIERCASRERHGLFSAVFGTGKVAVMRAYLHRGILRAAALEYLLLQRAAAGQDVAPAPLHTNAALGMVPNADPCNEPFKDQVARLTAERAQHDAPADPASAATAEQIEAEVRDRPIGRTIDDIRRDLGVVAIMCTPKFWAATTHAIACYQDSAAVWREDSQSEPARGRQKPKNDPDQQQTDRHHDTQSRRHATRAPNVIARSEATKQPRPDESPPHVHPDHPDSFGTSLVVLALCCASLIPGADLNPRRPWFKRREHAADPFRRRPAQDRRRLNVPVSQKYGTRPAAATGPPPSAALQYST